MKLIVLAATMIFIPVMAFAETGYDKSPELLSKYSECEESFDQENLDIATGGSGSYMEKWGSLWLDEYLVDDIVRGPASTSRGEHVVLLPTFRTQTRTWTELVLGAVDWIIENNPERVDDIIAIGIPLAEYYYGKERFRKVVSLYDESLRGDFKQYGQFVNCIGEADHYWMRSDRYRHHHPFMKTLFFRKYEKLGDQGESFIQNARVIVDTLKTMTSPKVALE